MNGAERNAALLAAYEAGDTLSEAGARFGLTKQRAHQIVRKLAPDRMRRIGATKRWNADLYARGSVANREPISIVCCVVRRYGTADTLTIRDQVRRVLLDDTITDASVDRILSAHRECLRLQRGAA